MGLNLECWNNLRDISVISLLSQLIILTLFFSLYRPIGEEKRRKILRFSPPFPMVPLLLLFIFFNLLFCINFLHTSILLGLRCVSCVFTLAFYVFFGWLLMGVVHIIRNVLLSWINVYLLRNIKDWNCLRVSMTELRSAENRTPRTCMSSEFFGFNTDVFAFLWYF